MFGRKTEFKELKNYIDSLNERFGEIEEDLNWIERKIGNQKGVEDQLNEITKRLESLELSVGKIDAIMYNLEKSLSKNYEKENLNNEESLEQDSTEDEY